MIAFWSTAPWRRSAVLWASSKPRSYWPPDPGSPERGMYVSSSLRICGRPCRDRREIYRGGPGRRDHPPGGGSRPCRNELGRCLVVVAAVHAQPRTGCVQSASGASHSVAVPLLFGNAARRSPFRRIATQRLALRSTGRGRSGRCKSQQPRERRRKSLWSCGCGEEAATPRTEHTAGVSAPRP